MKYAVEDQMEVLEDLGVAGVNGVNVSGLAAAKSIAKEKDGSNTVYTLTLKDGMGGMMDNIMDLALQNTGETGSATNIGEVRIYYLLDRKGSLTEMGLQMPFYMAMEVTDDAGPAVTAEADCDMRMVMTVNATGKDVRIDYPDLSAFVEVVSTGEVPAA